METEKKSLFRFPAVKVSIKEIEEGEYVEDQEQNPNYIIIKNDYKIFRINLIATLVYKEIRGSISSILIDDGTAKIILRLFEENKISFDLEVGDVIQIIGKVRIYNQEKYIFPEIIKKVNPLWLKVRFIELQKSLIKEMKEKKHSQEKSLITDKKAIEIKIETKSEKAKLEVVLEAQIESKNTSEEVVNEEIEENDPLLPYQKLTKLISQLDNGEGVLIEEVIEKSPLEKTEELLEKMIENGDIFQNMPGKVRVL